MATPYSQTEQQQGIAGYAAPYVQNMLGAAQSQLFNTDASGNLTGLRGYTPYSYNAADYFAGFTPLQQQAQQGSSAINQMCNHCILTTYNFYLILAP